MAGRWTTIVSLCTVAAAPWSAAAADDADLAAQIADLEARVAALEGEPWLNQRRREEMRSLIADVLADADTRASLLDDGLAAGWDEGFFIASADRNYLLRIGALIQFREFFNHRHGPDRSRFGFEQARTRLVFSGHAIDPSLTFMVRAHFGRSGGRYSLEDAYVRWAFHDDWAVTAGQFRIPLLREILVARSRQQLVERSLVHSTFTAARSQGVMIEHNSDRWRLRGSFTDRMASTGGFNAPWHAPNVEYALTARAEHRLAGEWRQFDGFTSWPGEPFALMLGGAIHYQKGEGGSPFEGDALVWTVDASAQFGGANLFAYVVGRRLEPRGDDSLDQLGAVVQGGWLVLPKWEVFARYEWGDSDRNEPNLSVVTAGVTRFTARHRLKWMIDAGYAFNPVAPIWSFNPAGWRTDTAGRRGQIVVRTQLQAAF